MLLKNKIDKIKTFIKPDNVLTTLEERYCYATDASNKSFENVTTPDIVVFVETIKDVQNIIKFANLHEIPIISRGAGTNMVGACLCPQGGIVLNFSKMNKILEISEQNLTATVQPGVVLGDLKKVVDKKSLFFPPDPSNYRVSTIGGAIAQSSGGALSFKYGTIKDYVLSLKVVTADGKLMHLGSNTIKDSSGYHLNQLIIGSEGTLAIVVEATLKLIPKPETTQIMLAYYNSIEQSIKSVNEILLNNIYPSAIDFMDKNSIITVEEYSRYGLDTESECVLIIEFDGFRNSIITQFEKTKKIIEKYDGKALFIIGEKESERLWQARHSSFAAASRLAPDVISDDIIVPRENLLLMINGCNKICSKYDINLCLVGHVGDGNIHPQMVLNLEDETDYRKCQNAKAEIYTLAKNLGGTISAEHGIGIEKMSYLENTIDKEALEYMKLIKKAFDPKNILNPGKIFRI